jgi:hypothetical protein
MGEHFAFCDFLRAERGWFAFAKATEKGYSADPLSLLISESEVFGQNLAFVDF